MPDDSVKTINQSLAMRAATVHIMLLDDYIGAVLSRARAPGPGFLRESLIDHVETLQRERLSSCRVDFSILSPPSKKIRPPRWKRRPDPTEPALKERAVGSHDPTA